MPVPPVVGATLGSSCGGILGSGAESPWGTCCTELPGAEFVESTFLIRATTLTSHLGFEPFSSGNQGLSAFWADELNTDELQKTRAAMDLLGTAESRALIGTLQQSVPMLQAPLRRVEQRLFGVHMDSDRNNSVLSPLDPLVIGINNQSSPWYKLVYQENSSLSTIKKVVTRDLDPPSSYAFPLNWPDAMEYVDPGAPDDPPVTLGLAAADTNRKGEKSVKEKILDAAEWLRGEGDDDEFRDFAGGVWGGLYAFSFPLGMIPLILFRRGLREAASEFADALEDGANEERLNDTLADILAGAIDLTEPIVGWIAFWIGLLEGLLQFVGAIALSTRWVLALLWGVMADVMLGLFRALGLVSSDDMDDVAVALRDFADDSGRVGDALEALGEVVDNVEHFGGEGLLGLSEREADELRLALGTSSIADGDIRPLLHISPDHFDYYYDGYSTQYLPTDESAWPQDLVRCWPRWVRQAGPTLQFAFTLDLASVILEQALNQESALMVASGLADNEGTIGSTMRELLKAQGYECLSEALGGISFSRFLRYLWRQYMTDKFVQSWIDEGYSPDCLYEIFCWMRTSASRDNLDVVLGPQQMMAEYGDPPRDYADHDALLSGLVAGADLCHWWDDLSCAEQQAVRDFLANQACSLSDRLDALECEPGPDEEESDHWPWTGPRPPWFHPWDTGSVTTGILFEPPDELIAIDITRGVTWDDWFRGVTSTYDDMLGILWDRYGPWTGSEPDVSFFETTRLDPTALAGVRASAASAASYQAVAAVRARSSTWLSGGGFEALRDV